MRGNKLINVILFKNKFHDDLMATTHPQTVTIKVTAKFPVFYHKPSMKTTLQKREFFGEMMNVQKCYSLV